MSLDKLISKYFIVFEAIVNRIVFLSSLLASLLLVYRSATDFCVSILYPATLLNVLISSNSIFWSLKGFLLDHVICKQTVLLLLFYMDDFSLFFLA